ncbi:MAG: hypothetical protein ABR986_02900 [Methanomassiliicoccales archaeon]|jgi:hypothetical protein
MDKETILKQVEDTLRAIPGVMDVWFLEKEDRSRLESIEREAESHGACGGLMPFVNRGVWATMSRDVVAIIVISSSIPLIGDQFNIVFIEDQNKQVIGEWLTPQRQEEFKDRKDVCRIGPDFIIYGDRPPVGEPYFVLPELEFHFLDEIKGVQDVTSGSISTPADDWIRLELGYTETKHWTHVIGFNVKEE